MKTILITGATGFLGSYILEKLIQENYNVILLKRSSSSKWRINHLRKNIKSYNIDISPMEKAFSENKIDCVVHTACHYGLFNNSVSEIIQSNLIYGLELVELAIKFKVKTFINTDSLLPRTLNAYSLSKRQFGEWLETKSNVIKIVNLKVDYIYGPKDNKKKFVHWIISEFKSNSPYINLTSGVQKRDFIFVEDVASAYIKIIGNLEKMANWSEFEIGTGNSIQVKSFVKKLKQLYEDKNGKVLTMLKFGIIPYRFGELMEHKINNKSLLKLGWKPEYNIEQGLMKLINE